MAGRDVGSGVESDPVEKLSVVNCFLISAANDEPETIEHPLAFLIVAPICGLFAKPQPFIVGEHRRAARRAQPSSGARKRKQDLAR